MKKCLIFLLILLFFLYSCRGGDPGGAKGSLSASSTSRHESPGGEPAGEDSVSPADTPEKARFLQTAAHLLRKDGDIAALIIVGGIYKDEAEFKTDVSLRPLSENNPYGEFAVLQTFIDSVYTQKAGEYVLSFPPYGTPTVKNIDGKTWSSTHFAPQAVHMDPNFAPQLVEYDEESALVLVETDAGFRISVPFTYTPGGWRMDACLYRLAAEYKNKTPEALDSRRFLSMNAGSAPKLAGKTLLINIFINDLVSEWDEKAVLSVLEREQSACLFLENTAKSHQIPLEIEITGEKTSLYLETAEKIPTGVNDFIWIDLLFSHTVYTSLEGYIRRSFDTARYDGWCAVLCLNKKGQSFALSCDKEHSDWERYVAERAVIYHTDDESYAYFDSPGVYAHELLHLFGARDLYPPYVDSLKDSLLENYFPNDIMRVIPSDIGLAAVSPYTAFRVGWLGYLEEQFLFLVS